MTNYELKITSTNPAELAAILSAISIPVRAAENIKAEVSIPAEMTAPVPLPAGPSANSVPKAQEITLPALRAQANTIARQGKSAAIKALLADFGVDAMTKLPSDRYAEFAAALGAL